jgi:hypothetical protein
MTQEEKPDSNRSPVLIHKKSIYARPGPLGGGVLLGLDPGFEVPGLDPGFVEPGLFESGLFGFGLFDPGVVELGLPVPGVVGVVFGVVPGVVLSGVVGG